MKRTVIVMLALFAVTACERSLEDGDSILDGGLDGGRLVDGRANIWIDPDGCHHWYIDDGLEGYMTPRLQRDGRPVCQDDRQNIVLKDGTVIAAEVEPTAD